MSVPLGYKWDRDKAPTYPSIGPAPCETCFMARACEASELACQEFYTWVNAESGSFAKLRAKDAGEPNRPTKYIYDTMMAGANSGRPRKAA